MESTSEQRICSREIDFRDLHVKEWVLENFSSCARHKPYALLLHGWMGKGSDFTDVSVKLAESGFHVIVPDLPYHGMSIRSRPETIQKTAQELIAVLRFLIRPAFHNNIPLAIIGYSLGGRIALELCSICARQSINFITLRAVVLISCAPAPSTPSESVWCTHSSQTHADALLRLSSAAEYNTWLRLSWYQNSMWGMLPQTPGFDSFIASRVQDFSIAQRDAWATAAICFDRATMSPIASYSLQTRALYVCGSFDTKYLKFVERIQSLFPSIDSIVVPEAGHNVLLEAPTIVTREVVLFLSTVCSLSITQTHFSLNRVLVREYTLKLRQPISVNGQNISSREGILISLQTSSGATGVGDVCPLPGLHSMSIASCHSEIKQFRFRLKEWNQSRNLPCALCVDLLGLNQFTEGLSDVVRNGVECAMIHLLSETIGIKMAVVLRKLLSTTVDENDDIFDNSSHNESVYINGVIPRKAFTSTKEPFSLEAMTETPFRTVKLKVGVASNSTEDALFVTNVARACQRANKRLRLDANRAWCAADYNKFYRKLEELGTPFEVIEYIEEPLRNVSLLHDVLHSSEKFPCDLRIALDETLTDCTASDSMLIELANHCEAFVVKPTVIGSLQRLKKLIGMANDTNSVVILSSAFESGVGISWNAILASVVNVLAKTNSEALEPRCHGLGTYKYLIQDVVNSQFSSDCLQADESAVCLQQCYQCLTKAAKFVLYAKPPL